MSSFAIMSEQLMRVRVPADIQKFLVEARLWVEKNLISIDQFALLLNSAQERQASFRTRSDRTVGQLSTIFPSILKRCGNRSHAASGKRNTKDWARKRNLGSSPRLPLDDRMRGLFTEGERAVLYVILADCEKKGRCTDYVESIARRAGVGLTTARNAMRKAKSPEVGLLAIQQRPRPGQKHLSNIITVSAWTLADAANRPRPRAIGPIGFKLAATLELNNINSGKNGLLHKSIARFLNQNSIESSYKQLEDAHSSP